MTYERKKVLYCLGKPLYISPLTNLPPGLYVMPSADTGGSPYVLPIM